MLFVSVLQLLVPLFALLGIFAGQLSGRVGPLTTSASKAAIKTCNVLNYGATADKATDLGPPLTLAFAACKTGGLVVIPSGDYALKTWANLSGGSKWALQLDGTIHRTGTDGGNMIFIQRTNDFELFSSDAKGAVQGNGYEIHKTGSITGARILRFFRVKDFSIHDVALTDAPSFHFSMDTCENGEVYNMAIRGANKGGLDGIDVWSTNIWIHDIEVTNRDECVTVKSPSLNLLIENIYCNLSGGSALGSLGASTNISNIHYRNIYTWSSNQMLMIKSFGGSGSVSDVLFENFIGHGNAYSLNIDQYWGSMKEQPGNGVQLNNITFRGWRGTAANGMQRGPIKMLCADGAPCTDINVQDFAMWTETGSKQTYTCRSAYGEGGCLKPEGESQYAVVTQTVSAAPTGFSVPKMAANLKSDFGFTIPIPVPTIPTSFYPGATPVSRLAGSK